MVIITPFSFSQTAFSTASSIYETLYLNRIPITLNKTLYTLLHHNFPVVLLEHPEQLLDFNFIKSELEKAKTKIWDKNMLDLNYWKNLILSYT